MIILENRASVAQQVEHPAVNRTVGSSSLSRGATYLPLGINGGLVKTLWNIRNLSKNTQLIHSKNLRRLARESNLNEPKNVEEFVFNLNVTNKYRNALFDAYSQYCSANELDWDRPSIKIEVYPVKIPTEENIDKVIACASYKYAAIFHLSKHGLRPDEISKIILRDIDFQRGALSVRTSKMGLDRTLKLKPEALDLLKHYVFSNQIIDITDLCFLNLVHSSIGISYTYNSLPKTNIFDIFSVLFIFFNYYLKN